MANHKHTCSVIIPVFNGAGSLKQLIQQLIPALEDTFLEFEIILINDGSDDNSIDVIEELIQEHAEVRGIDMMRNYGQHNALLCGMRNAQCELCVTMDDDLQHPPSQIKKLLAKLDEGFDVVYGVPNKLPHSAWRNFFSKFTKRLLAFIIGIPSLKEISAFRIFRTSLCSASTNFNSPNVIIDVLLSWATKKFSSTEVEEQQREIGKSNYNFSKLLGQALLVLTGFSTKPLRIISFIGFGFTLFGIGIFIYVVIIYLISYSSPGFPFLASLIAIFSGVQLFSLGILGEYLGRVFDRSTDKPPYFINRLINPKRKSKTRKNTG